MSTYGLHHPRSATGRSTATRVALRDLGYRRGLQVALGLVWLVDAGLQYQPYMFGGTFVTQTLEPAAAGNPYIVEHPALWADHFMLHHIAFYNALFATLQLVIALAILFRPTVRVGLGVSVVWSLAVWWLAEGIGGITNNASPVMGAPGAVLVYALIALLVWPCRDPGDAGDDLGPSVAEAGALGRFAPRVLWAALWVGLLLLGLESTNRSPSAVHDMVQGMGQGEPGWITSMDDGLASALAHHGTEVSIALAVLFAFVALGGLVVPLRRPAVAVGVLLGLAIWVAEDFGAVFTGQATDVNSGLVLALLAACYWPLARGRRALGSAEPTLR
jgi:hypothetical protein